MTSTRIWRIERPLRTLGCGKLTGKQVLSNVVSAPGQAEYLGQNLGKMLGRAITHATRRTPACSEIATSLIRLCKRSPEGSTSESLTVLFPRDCSCQKCLPQTSDRSVDTLYGKGVVLGHSYRLLHAWECCMEADATAEQVRAPDDAVIRPRGSNRTPSA